MKVETLKKILDKFEDNDEVLVVIAPSGKVIKPLDAWTRGNKELVLYVNDQN